MNSTSTPQPIYALCDAIIFTGDAFVEGHALLLQGSTILDIVNPRAIPAAAQRHFLADRILSSGFIDVQVNGGGGILFNDTPTMEACLAIAAAHRKHGTTHILPTCITDRAEISKEAIRAVRAARQKNSGILGIHFEGPHLAEIARGIHRAAFIRSLRPEDNALYQPQPDEVMLVTIAPENVMPEQIKRLHDNGCHLALGHTQASPEQIHEALAAGATGFTHLYNGMGGMSARMPGVAGIALDDRDSWCSLIADGHHVATEMIRLALRAKPLGKVFLVSDAMPPAGSDHPKSFTLYNETITLTGGRCVNEAGQLAGSAITMVDAVRHCVQKVGVELAEALRMATLYPAAFLGLDKKLGTLLPGYRVDPIVLNHDLSTCALWRSLETNKCI